MPTIEQLNFFQAPLTGVGFRMLTGLRFSGIGRRFFAANINQRQYLAKDGVFDDKVYDNLFGMSISPSDWWELFETLRYDYDLTYYALSRC
jgi:hypothetical protein